MHPHLSANLAVLEELFADLAALIEPLDDACLNWSPAADGANSIAALVRHVLGSLDAWLSRALDEPFARDRDAEFRARDSAEALLTALAESRAGIRGQFERLEAVDLGEERRFQRLDAAGETSLTAAWCIAHAVIHAGEHWGQIQLTRDLYLARGSTVGAVDLLGRELPIGRSRRRHLP